jgi:hypothetical protein
MYVLRPAKNKVEALKGFYKIDVCQINDDKSLEIKSFSAKIINDAVYKDILTSIQAQFCSPLTPINTRSLHQLKNKTLPWILQKE